MAPVTFKMSGDDLSARVLVKAEGNNQRVNLPGKPKKITLNGDNLVFAKFIKD